MKHFVRGPISILILVCMSAAPAYAQVCAGGPSFGHFTWQTISGLEFVGGGLRGSTSLVGGRDALFAGALVSTGHSDGGSSASHIAGGIVGSDHVIHRRRRVHLCPTFKSLYTFGPRQGGPFGPSIDFATFSMAAEGSVAFVAHETVTRQVVPTLSIGFARDRTRATMQDRPVGELIDYFLTTKLGLGFVFDDQNAVTPQITMAFKDQKRVVGFLILTTLGFGIR